MLREDAGNEKEVPKFERKFCCGCSACYAICPVKAITMIPNNEGFCIQILVKSMYTLQKCIRACDNRN